MALRNTIGALFGALALGAVLAAVLAVSGCDIDSAYEGAAVSSNAEDPNAIVTTRIVGSVGDGPIENARVRVFTNSGEELSETRSSNTADYEITVRTQGRNYPLTIVADEGTDMVTRKPPDFSLASVVMSPGRNEIANLNPFGTLIVRTAEKSGGISYETIAAATDAVVERYGFGLGSSLVAHPIFSPMDDTNVHVVVKASETLGEMIRRTRDAVTPYCVDGIRDAEKEEIWRCGDAVVEALAADLVDGWIDGQGAEGHDLLRIAAVANVASAPVLLEALANRLYVYGEKSTEAMDDAIETVRPGTTLKTADVQITPEALMQARRALHAAMEVTNDIFVQKALYAVQTTEPGSTELNPLQSEWYNALDLALDALNKAIGDTAWSTTESVLVAINNMASSEDVRYLDNPYQPDPIEDDTGLVPDPIVEDPKEEEEKEKEEPTTPPVSGGPTEEENGETDGGAIEEEPIVEDEPVNYEPNAAPAIFGMPTTALVVQRAWSFTPEAYDPDGDTLAFSVENLPAWAEFDKKTGRIWGAPMQSGSHGPITITVSDHMDSTSLEPFTLQVDDPALGAVKITWAAPTEREDGTALEDLAGFRIHYGRDPDALTHAINIKDANQSSQLIENLDTGDWHFAVSAYDSNWAESAKSSFATKTIN